MKTLFLKSACTFALLALAFIGCGKKDKDDPKSPAFDGSFSATVTGGSTPNFQANTGRAVLTNKSGISLYTLYIEGVNKESKTAIISMARSESAITTGSYPFKYYEVHDAYFYENFDVSGTQAWLCPDRTISDTNLVHGTITFTEITQNRVKGSITFKARSDANNTSLSYRAISSGNFDLPMTRQGF